VYLMYGDEADAEEGRGQKFFLYGGIFVEHAKAWTAHLRIEDLRKKAGFGAQDTRTLRTLKAPSSRTVVQGRLERPSRPAIHGGIVQGTCFGPDST
jgi:hypothetical protein